MTIILDIILALSKGVPKFDCSVTRTRDNLSVVCAEANRQDIGGVANESAGGLTSVQIPETQGVVPRGGKGELSIGRDDDVRDEVVVAMKNSFGVAIRVFITSKLPDDDGLVWALRSTKELCKNVIHTSGSRQNHVWVLRGGSNSGNPSFVAGEGAEKTQGFSH